MLKKTITMLLVTSIMLVLGGCKGSKDIQGTWYAVNSDSTPMMIELTDQTITFKMEGEEDRKEEYTQTGTGVRNNTSYKQLKVGDKSFSFVFPDKKDKTKGIIIETLGDDALYGDVYWAVSKHDTPQYDGFKD